MKSIDEFGSVLVMAALVLGACAAVDGVFLPVAAGDAAATPPMVAHAAASFIAVVHQDRVILADHSHAQAAAAEVGNTAQAATMQQARVSW